MSNSPEPGVNAGWVKSSYSGGEGGNCLEWAPEHATLTGEFLIRDSKNPSGPQLALTREAFTALVQHARRHG